MEIDLELSVVFEATQTSQYSPYCARIIFPTGTVAIPSVKNYAVHAAVHTGKIAC